MSLSLGPLTTEFKPAPSCTTDVWLIEVSTDGQGYYLLGPPPTSDCFPSNYNEASTAYYSPGRCPTGYTAVKSDSYVIGDLTETQEVCCPTAMEFSAQSTGGSPRVVRTYENTLMCVSGWESTATITVTRSPVNGEPSETSYTDSKGALNAYGIIVKHQAKDFASPIATTSVSPNSGNSTTSSTNQGPNNPSSTDSTQQDGSSGLSSGASIGIGVSVGMVGVALIIGGVYLILRYRRKRNALRNADTAAHIDYPEAVSTYVTKAPQEIGSSPLPPQELEGRW